MRIATSITVKRWSRALLWRI